MKRFPLPLLLWLSCQLIAVALTAGRFPLWAKHPPTGESLALQALLIIQLTSSALLFPILVHTIQGTAATIASGWPFALASAALSSTPTAHVYLAESYVSLWLIALYLWRVAFRSTRAIATVHATAICFVLSGPIYRYLLMDFSADSSVGNPIPFARLTPVESCLSLLTSGRDVAYPSLHLAFLLAAPILAVLCNRLLTARRS